MPTRIVVTNQALPCRQQYGTVISAADIQGIYFNVRLDGHPPGYTTLLQRTDFNETTKVCPITY